MFKFFKSEFFNFEFLRLLGTAPFDGSDVAECLEGASRVSCCSPEKWYRVWIDLGERTQIKAEEAEKLGDTETARRAWLRSSNYFRASEYFLPTFDARRLPAIQKSVNNFHSATKLMAGPVISTEVNYEGALLPAFLFMPVPGKCAGNGSKVPVILTTGGFDSTQEELYYYLAAGATSRGYAVLSVEGPGQGIVLRRHGLSLRPDWEAVTRPSLDRLFELASEIPSLNIDTSRIAVFGASMGGYFALRAAAADSRVAACISVDGFYNLFDVLASRMPRWFVNAWNRGTFGDGIFNATVNAVGWLNFQVGWEFRNCMWTFGASTPAEAARYMQGFSLQDRLENVKCPVLVTGAGNTIYFPPQANAHCIFEALVRRENTKTDLWIAEGIGQGGLQAKVGALNLLHARILQWLDSQFSVIPR